MNLPYRSRDRVLTGVAGGVANRLGMHPVLARIVWLVSVPFTAFTSLLLDVVLAVVLPEEPAALAAERRAGTSLGGWLLVREFAAALVAAHGLVHLIGFAVPWRLASFDGVPYTTSALWGQLELGDQPTKALALVWLALVPAFLVAAVGIYRGTGWARLATAASAAVSLVVCALGSPAAIVGLAVDVAILAAIVLSAAPFGRLAPSRAVAR